MARLDIAVDHGQTPEVARVNFERAVASAQARFAAWIHRLDWAEDRTGITVAGPGFHAEVSYDDQKVYARGTVPLAFKMLQGRIKSYLARALAEES